MYHSGCFWCWWWYACALNSFSCDEKALKSNNVVSFAANNTRYDYVPTKNNSICLIFSSFIHFSPHFIKSVRLLLWKCFQLYVCVWVCVHHAKQFCLTTGTKKTINRLMLAYYRTVAAVFVATLFFFLIAQNLWVKMQNAHTNVTNFQSETMRCEQFWNDEVYALAYT